mmetsp:Transcript_36879/g.86451  ORF Transcript_36879/g.86451 Transcript_36879/m.86451 type:complete len:253 (-) Transcript_36879:193-951(-)
MASRIAIAATFATGCSAFVAPAGPQLRSTATSQGHLATQPAPEASSASSFFAAGSVASVVAVAAAAQKSATRGAKVQRQVVGVCEPLDGKFDPLGLGTEEKMARYTEVEIKHGRVAMLACLGYAGPQQFKFIGCEGIKNGLGAFETLPAEGWLQLVLFIGAHEILVKPREGGLGNFDFGWGTDLLEGQSEEEIERRQTVERNNGRLAMIGIWGLVVQDYMFGDPIVSMGTKGFWSEYEWVIAKVPLCKGGIC